MQTLAVQLTTKKGVRLCSARIKCNGERGESSIGIGREWRVWIWVIGTDRFVVALDSLFGMIAVADEADGQKGDKLWTLKFKT